MQNIDAPVPEPEFLDAEETSNRPNRIRLIATIAVVALALFVCLCLGGFWWLGFLGGGASVATPRPTSTRVTSFAATWTPTPTETSAPTATPRATSTRTPTPTNTPTETPLPTDTATPRPTNTPRPPTNTPTPRPPTNTPVPPTPTNTPVPPTATPSYLFRAVNTAKYANCGVRTLFGTVRSRFGDLYPNVRVSLISSSGAGLATTTINAYIRNSPDRNYEIDLNNPAPGLGPIAAGNYTFMALDFLNTPVSQPFQIAIAGQSDNCGAGGSGSQVWQIDLVAQNQ